MADEMISVFGCEKDERQLFERYAAHYGVEICCVHDPLRHENACGIPPESAISVNHKAPVDARLIRALQGRGVKYLSSRSVGLDHIDGDAAKMAGILVESVAYSPESVAEYTIMLMLMALRNAGSILRRARSCDFRLEEKRAPELRDMTVGVVGTGRIGKAVIERLSGFGCAILAYDPHPNANAAYVDLDELLRRSDLVTLHLPLTAATRHLLDRARIARMRRGAILVNTARGALVDGLALTDALERGGIAGVALDVVEGEEGWFYRDC
ncbi:MAG TPA: NAD(P)-dependent oxidoreductase, partial [Clostridia bacterium]|nr:NAD(P)-dependent oxidoreductase [Clostridia bacterium]